MWLEGFPMFQSIMTCLYFHNSTVLLPSLDLFPFFLISPRRLSLTTRSSLLWWRLSALAVELLTLSSVNPTFRRYIFVSVFDCERLSYSSPQEEDFVANLSGAFVPLPTAAEIAELVTRLDKAEATLKAKAAAATGAEKELLDSLYAKTRFSKVRRQRLFFFHFGHVLFHLLFFLLEISSTFVDREQGQGFWYLEGDCPRVFRLWRLGAILQRESRSSSPWAHHSAWYVL